MGTELERSIPTVISMKSRVEEGAWVNHLDEFRDVQGSSEANLTNLADSQHPSPLPPCPFEASRCWEDDFIRLPWLWNRLVAHAQGHSYARRSRADILEGWPNALIFGIRQGQSIDLATALDGWNPRLAALATHPLTLQKITMVALHTGMRQAPLHPPRQWGSLPMKVR